MSARRPERGDNEALGETRAEYEWADVGPSTAVLETIGAAMDRDPLTLDPLYEYVDLDALDLLVRSASPGAPAAVSFRFKSYRVRVESAGEVVVRPV